MNSVRSFQKNVWSSLKDSAPAESVIKDWSDKIEGWASCMVLYFTSAIAGASVSVQVQAQLPLIFHFLYLSILLGFTCLLFAEFVRFKSDMPTQILRCLSLLSLVVAFFVAISIPFPLYFRIISLVVFLAALSRIFCFATILGLREHRFLNQTILMNSARPFLKNVWSSLQDSAAADSVIEDWSDKIEGWASCLMDFYFTSAIAGAAVSVQVQTELPLIFHFLYLSILLGFTCLLLAEFPRIKSDMPTQILRCLSLLSLVVAFFVAISIPFPLYFKFISLIAFLAALSIIFCYAPTIPAT